MSSGNDKFSFLLMKSDAILWCVKLEIQGMKGLCGEKIISEKHNLLNWEVLFLDLYLICICYIFIYIYFNLHSLEYIKIYINVEVGLLSKATLEKKCTCIYLEIFGNFTEFFLLDLENCVSNYCLRN